jgi:hypothetical protein
MKRLALGVAVLAMVLVGFAVPVSAGPITTITYSIRDYPSYQTDIVTGLTDHVSGTIVADVDLSLGVGVISSASFTLTNAGGTSYTVSSATITTPYYLHFTDTEITLTPTNPSNSLNYGSLHLTGLTDVGGYSAILDWYTPGQQWYAGSNNWAGYSGSVYLGSKTYGVNFASDHDATAFTQGTVHGSYDSIVVATAVPDPGGTLTLLGCAVVGLGALRRRFRG